MTKENKKDYIGSVKIKHKWLWLSLAIIAALCFIAVGVFQVYLNAMNITEIGDKYLSLYTKNIHVSILCYLTAFIISMLCFIVTNIIIKKNLLKWEESGVYLKSKFTFLLANVVLSFVAASTLTPDVSQYVLQAMSPTWFIYDDPIFSRNIGYYLFQRPLLVSVSQWGFILFGINLLYALVVYFMFYVRNGAGGIKEILKQKQIVNHCFAIILTIYALVALTSNLTAEYLILQTDVSGMKGGFTNISVWTNYYKLLPFIMFIIIVTAIIFIAAKKTKYTLFTVLIYPAVLIFVALYSFGVEAFYVNPNRATIERPYIKNKIESTLVAYDLKDIDESKYKLTGSINERTIAESSSSLNNIIVNDEENALYTLKSLPSDSKFFVYKDADLVPTNHGNTITTAFTSAKEVFIDGSDKTLNEYNNLKMRYTHGRGLGITPSTDMPPVYNMPNSPVKETAQPQIYFGETEKDSKKDYIITGTSIGEYDGADGSKERISSYDGPAGIKLTPLNRILYAFRYGQPAIAFSGDITNESKLLFNRNIIERAKIAIPFLTYDNDPYLVETDSGKLVWILDAYTTTNNYPYAVKLYDLDKKYGTNYIRNSVKLTIDAYTGEINAYIIDWDDPIIRTLSSIYPEAFVSGPIPDEIEQHLKYPRKLFELQCEIFKTYHDTNPATFYTGDNALEYPLSKWVEGSTVAAVKPYYQVLNINGANELMLMTPFVPAGNSENITGILMVSSAANNYGKLSFYRFPDNSFVHGIIPTENRIDADETISAELEKMSVEGTVSYGQTQVLPVMNTILYMKPVYLKNDTHILRNIILGCGETVVMDKTLGGCLSKLAALKPKTDYTFMTPPEMQTDKEHTIIHYNDLVISAINKYEEAKQFSTEGDWENYGRSMAEFENILDEIKYDITYPSEDEAEEPEAE